MSAFHLLDRYHFQLTELLPEALILVIKMFCGTSLRIKDSNSLLWRAPAVVIIPICFFFVNIQACLNGGFTPMIERPVFFLTSSNI